MVLPIGLLEPQYQNKYSLARVITPTSYDR